MLGDGFAPVEGAATSSSTSANRAQSVYDLLGEDRRLFVVQLPQGDDARDPCLFEELVPAGLPVIAQPLD